MSFLCFAAAAVATVVGAILMVRHHPDAGVALFYAGILPVFGIVARVIERATPPGR